MKFHKRGLLLIAMMMMAGVAFAQTWTQTSAQQMEWFSVASSADGTKLVAAAVSSGSNYDTCAIFTSTNSGAVWTQMPFPTNNNWVHVASSADGSKLVAAASADSARFPIYLSTNSGATWSSNNAPPSADWWYSVASSADGTKLVAVGRLDSPSRGVVYSSADSGNTWTSNNLPVVPSSWLSVASSADGNKLVVASYYGQICTTTNAGATWQQANNAPSTGNYGAFVASSADGSKLVAAVSRYQDSVFTGSIYTSTNSGMTWNSNNVPNISEWYSVASSADGAKLVAVGSSISPGGGVVCVSTNGGLTWTEAMQEYLTVILSADGNRLFALRGGETGAGGGMYMAESSGIDAAYWPPSAILDLIPSPTNLMLAWVVPSTNFMLQTSADLVSWSDVTNPPALNLTNLQNQVTLPLSGSSGFFRLKTP